MKSRLLFGIFLLLFSGIAADLFAQGSSLEGVVSHKNEAFPGAVLRLAGEVESTALSDADGRFVFNNLPKGSYQLTVSALGMQNWSQEITLGQNPKKTLEVNLQEDRLQLDQVVVSATRSPIPLYDAPVIVSQLSDRTLDVTQSVSVAEGLNFSPGLRVENNCSNCGFTQLRMNGLDGAYSQILINSRPVFSALAGVYGLEMIPQNMVERIEVVKGGGSALYGGNAIGGTVNIITKDPIKNSFGIGMNQALINGDASDRTLNFNGAIVSKDFMKGISFYGFNRNRDWWDANGDGFSEITELENTTFGVNAYWQPKERSKWSLNLNSITEYRRGGNDFDLEPHQSDIAEQLEHQILGGGLSYEWTSKDLDHRVSVYTSSQYVTRDSYYGVGGRVLQPGDSLTDDDILAINAYGESEDISVVAGLQWTYDITQKLVWTLGSEYQLNDVKDQMPGYARTIEQRAAVLGNYAQLEYKPNQKLSFLLGGRFDYVSIDGLYSFGDENFDNQQNLPILVPRLTAMYELNKNMKVRASYAQGYRAPQAFDEDLHIETVGGAALFILLDPDLKTERSNSYTASWNYTRSTNKDQINLVVEGFRTELMNPFILSDQMELPSGVAVITKRNGSGAVVQGLNLEINYALGSDWVIQGGATIQSATYEQTEVLWESEDPGESAEVTSTDRILRTPNLYGFFTVSWTPNEFWSTSISGTYTGRMDIPHVVDAETERTIIQETPEFLAMNIKAAYTLPLDKELDLTFSVGVQNLFNSYQDDFDIGTDRDAGYIYGPILPRTFFGGIKLNLY